MDLYLMYLRKSRTDNDFLDDPTGELTLSRHKKILDALVEQNHYHVARILYEVKSGDSIAARPEMQKLLELVKTGDYAGVICMDTQRLARGDSSDQALISKIFSITGTKIVTPGKIFDPSDESDSDYMDFDLFMGRKEYKMIKKRLYRGRSSSAAEGKFVGSIAPFGYDKYKLKGERGYSLRKNADAGTVEMMYNWFNGIGCERIGAKSIANKLNEMHLFTAKGNLWTGPQICSMLKNPVYAGFIRWGYRKEKEVFIDGTLVKRRQQDKSNEHSLVKGRHEGIISEDLYFETIKNFNQYNYNPPINDKYALQNPFVGLIRCTKCGHTMVRKPHRTGKDFLMCPQQSCTTVSSYMTKVEESILNELRKYTYAFNPTKFNLSNDLLNIDLKKEQVQKEYSRLDALKVQQDRLYDFLEQGVYTPDIFKERSKKLESSFLETRNTIEALESELAELKAQQYRLETFIPRAQNLLENYATLSVEDRNILLKELIDHIDYTKDKPCKKGIDKDTLSLRIYPRI